MKKENIRQHIIGTASELFYPNGYHATGVNEIIKKAGIAKATLYHHFNSKEDICIAYLMERHNQFMADLKVFIAQCETSKHRLLGIFDLLRNRYRGGDFYGCWGQKILSELDPENQNLLRVIQKQKKELLLYLGEVVDDSLALISKAESERISGGLYLLFESAITQSHLHKNDWPIHLAKTLAQDLFKEAQLKK